MSGYVDAGAETQSYIYNDLSVSYVEYMKENLPQVFAVSGFQRTNSTILHKQALAQARFYERCSTVFCMGHWLKSFLVKSGLPDDKVIHVGGGINVDFSLIKPQKKSHNKILFVGKDFKRKGGHVTYEAFKILKKRGENVELYVAGPEVNPIQKPIEGYHYEGQVNFKKVAELFNMCDVFCMPSYFEAYGLVFIEALTFGLPCIGRNCYEMPYFIEDGKTGLLLKKDDANELANLMMKILSDNHFNDNVAKRHDYYINEYSWKTVAKRMKEAMDKSK